MLKRGKFVLLLVALGLLFSVMSVSAQGEVVVCAWGGKSQEVMRETFFPAFEKATGIKVIDVSEPDTARIKAMVDTGNVEWDVVTIPLDYYAVLGENYFEPIDYARYPKEQLDGFTESAKHPYGIARDYFAIAMSYRTDVYPVGNHPTSWADFWNVEKFPGNRALHAVGGFPNAALEAALLADGVEPANLYPLDVDRAFASLDKIKPYVTKWFSSWSEITQMLANGEVDATQMGSAAVFNLKEKDNAPVEIEWNQGILYSDYWLVVKGAKNAENAQKFIQFVTTAEAQGEFHSAYPDGPTNSGAFKYIPAEQAEKLPSNPARMDKMIISDDIWWGANREKVSERFAEWLLK